MTLQASHVSPWITRAAGALLFFLCVAPVVSAMLPLLSEPGTALTELGGLLSSGRLWGLWLKTAAIAAGSALAATLLGAPLGLWLAAPAAQPRRSMAILLGLPLFLPPHILAVAWIDVLGPQGLLVSWGLPAFPLYSPSGVVLLQALGWYPIPLFAMWHQRRQQDPAIGEAARTLAPATAVLRHITLPLLYPALGAAALVVFILSLLSFSVPSLLQVPVFTVEIFTSFNSLHDQRQAVLLALPLVLTGGGGAVVLLWLAGNQPPARAHTQVATGTGGKGRWPVFILIALTLGLPALALLRRVGAPTMLLAAWKTGLEEIGASLLLAALGATFLLLLFVPLALLRRGEGALYGGVAALAYLVSGPVFGTGLIQLWNHAGPAGYVYDRFPILVIAVMGRYALFAWIGCRLAARWLPPELPAAARNLGATPWHTLRHVSLPALRRPLGAVWAGLFLLIMGELECIILVAPPGWVPVSLRIFTIMHYGPTEMVSALALLQALATLAVLGLFAALRPRGIVYTTGKSRYHT